MAASKAAALPLGDRPTALVYNKTLKLERMVRKERLELSHLAAPEPKSGASTNSATSAYCQLRVTVVSLVVLIKTVIGKTEMKNNGAERET